MYMFKWYLFGLGVRMDKKILILIFVFASLIFISSCEYYPSGQTEKVVGTRGLTLELQRSSMADRIFEGEPFFILLRMRNEGAIDIENGVLFVSADPHVFSITNKEEYEYYNLRGDDGIFRGDEIVTQISLQSKESSRAGVTGFDSPITINACYEYGTFFQDTFCIDTDLANQHRDKPCQMSSLSGSRGQGAPVVINEIRPRAIMGTEGVRITFDIYMYNSGTGNVLRSGSSESVCKGEFSSDDMGLVRISEIKLSTYRLSEGDFVCERHTENFNEFDLHGNQEFMSCRLVEELDFSLGTFSTPITIELDYGYLQTVSTSIHVQKIN